MSISKSKAKLIRRLASKRRPEDIARQLGLEEAEVRAVLAEIFPEGANAEFAPPWNLERLSFAWMLCLITVAPFPFSRTIYNFAELPKIGWIQGGSLVLAGLWGFHAFRNGPVQIRCLRSLLPFLVLALWCGASCLWAFDTYGALTTWFLFLAYLIVLGIGSQLLRGPAQRIEVLFKTIAFAGGAGACIGLAQRIFEVTWIPQTMPPGITFANKNMAGHFASLSFFASLGLFFLQKSLLRMVAAAVVLVVLGTFVMITESRGVYLGTFGGCLVFGLLYFVICLLRQKAVSPLQPSLWRERLSTLLACGVVIFLLAGIRPEGWRWGGAVLQKHLTRTTDDFKRQEKSTQVSGGILIGSQSSTQERFVLYRNSLELIRMRPMAGFGLANFRGAYPLAVPTGSQDRGLSLFRRPSHAHNDILQLTAELGLIGFAILLWCGITILREAFLIFRNIDDEAEAIVLTTATSGLTCYLILSMVSFPTFRALPPFLACTLIAPLFSIGSRVRERIMATAYQGHSKLGNPVVGQRLGLILGCGFLLIATLATALQFPRFRGDFAYQRQRDAIEKKRWQDVVQWGRRGTEADPFRPDFHLSSGSALLEMGRLEEAVEALNTYRLSLPHTISCLYYLARCHERLGDFEKAETLLLGLRKVIPHEGWIHRILGRVYASLGRQEEALASLRRATEVDPHTWEFHFFLGEYAIPRKEFDLAATAFRRVLELEDKQSRAHFYLGYILVQENATREEGEAHLRRAQELDPNAPYAEEIQRLLGE